MTTLSIDIETYSSVDITKSGLYKYVQSPDFEILLFAYAYDDGPVRVVDLASGERIPYFTVMDLHRPEVIKTAYNAAFEYYCRLSENSGKHGVKVWDMVSLSQQNHNGGRRHGVHSRSGSESGNSTA